MFCDDWMPLFGDDFWESESVAQMDDSAVCLYQWLIWRQWKHGPLPEPATLRRLPHRWTATWDAVWPQVSACFDILADGRLSNPRCAAEREKAEALAKRKSDAGSKGGRPPKKSRTKAPGKQAETSALAERNHTESCAKAEPKPRPDQTVQDKTEGTETNSRSTRAREADPASVPKSPHDALRAWWILRYAKATGGTLYAWDPIEDASKGNEMLKRARANGRGLDLVQEVVERFIAHPVFGKEAPTLGRIVANWNSLVALPAAAPAKAAAPGNVGKSVDQQTLERDVERAWMAKHDTEIEVPKHGGGTRKTRGPDRPYPGFESAKAELEQDARERKKESA